MKELFFFMSTLCSADDVWQQSNLAPASVLFSLLAFCLAVPAKVSWTFLNSVNCCKHCNVQVWNELHGNSWDPVNSVSTITSSSQETTSTCSRGNMFLNWHSIITAYFSIVFAPYLRVTMSLESLFTNLKSVFRNQDKKDNNKNWSIPKDSAYKYYNIYIYILQLWST